MHFTRDTERHLAVAAVPTISRPLERVYLSSKKPEKWPHSSENQAIRVFSLFFIDVYRSISRHFIPKQNLQNYIFYLFLRRQSLGQMLEFFLLSFPYRDGEERGAKTEPPLLFFPLVF